MIKISIEGSKIEPYDIVLSVFKGMLLLAGFCLFCLIILITLFLVCELVKKAFILIFKKKNAEKIQ